MRGIRGTWTRDTIKLSPFLLPPLLVERRWRTRRRNTFAEELSSPFVRQDEEGSVPVIVYRYIEHPRLRLIERKSLLPSPAFVNRRGAYRFYLPPRAHSTAEGILQGWPDRAHRRNARTDAATAGFIVTRIYNTSVHARARGIRAEQWPG